MFTMVRRRMHEQSENFRRMKIKEYTKQKPQPEKNTVTTEKFKKLDWLEEKISELKEKAVEFIQTGEQRKNWKKLEIP